MNIRREQISRGIVLEPQAIISRDIHYIVSMPIEGVDDFDSFKAAYFSIGNQHYFEIKQYEGHPKGTFTFYIDDEIKSVVEIKDTIEFFLKSLYIPNTALSWIRGDVFEYGVINRNDKDRMLEREASILVLKILYKNTLELSMNKLRIHCKEIYDPSNKDLEKNSRGDELWNQVIRNVVSNRSRKSSIFNRGFARYSKGKVSITASGIDFIKSIGF